MIVWLAPFRYAGIGETLKFNWFAFAAILAAYTSSMIESFGDYHSISYASGLPDPTPKMISKGIGAEGLGCMISGILGRRRNNFLYRKHRSCSSNWNCFKKGY